MKKLKQNEEAYKRRFESWWFSFFSVSNQTALIDNNDVNVVNEEIMKKGENSLHYETIDIRPSTWRTKLFVSLSHRVPRGALTIFFFFFYFFFISRDGLRR